MRNYKKALKLSQTPDIYAKIGQILSMQQNYTEATEYFSKSYALTENTAASKVVAKDEEKKEEIPEAEIIETPLKKE